nr:HAMP domain-containing sensor histidine kinase [Hymenobacter lucidus]
MLTQQNRFYLVGTLLLFALGSVGLYAVLGYEFRHEVDQDLRAEARLLTARLRAGQTVADADGLPTSPTLSAHPGLSGLRDTLLVNPYDSAHPLAPYRALTVRVITAAGPRWLTVRRSLLEAEDAREITLGVMLPLMGGLLVALLGLNRWLSRRVWRPLNQTVAQLRDYDGHRPLALAPTDIDEFAILHRTLEEMSQRLGHEYEALREFTENAAHETRTPLAILQARLEQLVQVPGLPLPARPLLVDALGGVSRLLRLYQGLTLLSKIENGQFAGQQLVDLGALVVARFTQLEEVIADKQLQVNAPSAALWVSMHPALAESLVHNLLNNAVRHGLPGGQVAVMISERKLVVSNTGMVPEAAPELFFQRFRKNDAASASPGLGLSIVQQIARLYGFDVSYIFESAASLHVLTVKV